MQGNKAPHGKGDFEKCPAVHTLHVDRRGFDDVVQLERVVHVRCPAQGEGEFVHPLPERQFGPTGAVAPFHDLLEFVLPDKGPLEG